MLNIYAFTVKRLVLISLLTYLLKHVYKRCVLLWYYYLVSSALLLCIFAFAEIHSVRKLKLHIACKKIHAVVLNKHIIVLSEFCNKQLHIEFHTYFILHCRITSHLRRHLLFLYSKNTTSGDFIDSVNQLFFSVRGVVSYFNFLNILCCG